MTVSCHESRDLLGMGRGAALVALQKRCVNVKHTSGAILVKGWGSGIVVSFCFLETGFHGVQTGHEFLMLLLPPPELLG